MIAAVLPCTAIPRSDLSHVCVCVMASSAVAPIPVYLGVCGMCSGTNALQSCVPAVQSYCGADPDDDYPAFCSMCTAQSPQDGCVATTQQMCTACDFDQYQSAYNALSTCMAAGTMCDCEFQSQDFLIASQRCGMPVATWVKDLTESAPDVCSAGATCTSAAMGTVVQRCALTDCRVGAASPTGDFKALRVQYNRLKNCTATTQVCNCGAELEDLNAAQGWCGTSLRTPLVPLIEDTCSVTSGCMSWHVPVCVVAWLWLCGKTVLATHTRPLRGLT